MYNKVEPQVILPGSSNTYLSDVNLTSPQPGEYGRNMYITCV